MSENDDRWSTVADRPKRTKRFPTWLIGCGIGCGLMSVLGILGLILLFRMGKNMVDPDQQWAGVGEYLEVVERPEGFQITGNPGFLKLALRSQGYEDGWNIVAHDQSVTVALFVLSGQAGAQAYELAFDDTLEQQPDVFQSVGFFEAEAGVLSTQGRDLRVLRYQRKATPPEADPGAADEGTEGEGDDSDEGGLMAEIRTGIAGAFTYSAARIDLTDEPSKGPYVLMEYRHTNRLERVPDAELIAFLENFDLSVD